LYKGKDLNYVIERNMNSLPIRLRMKMDLQIRGLDVPKKCLRLKFCQAISIAQKVLVFRKAGCRKPNFSYGMMIRLLDCSESGIPSRLDKKWGKYSSRR
jgi:hypothetical protein